MIIDVILPCLNEAPALPWVLEKMPSGFRPIVVDNRSTDGSGELARSLGAAVVTETAPGYGAAAHAGTPGPWLPAGFDVVTQADGSLDQRLACAFAAAAGPALLIGMDTPQVSPGLLAVDWNAADAVFDPAADALAVARQAPRSRFAERVRELALVPDRPAGMATVGTPRQTA